MRKICFGHLISCDVPLWVSSTFFFWHESYSEQYISQTGFFPYWISKLSLPFGEELVLSKVVIQADIPRRDAVVQAFKV